MDLVKTSDVGIIVVAAGRGMRAGGGLPKQYRALGGRMVLARTVEALGNALPDATLACVIHPDDSSLFDEAMSQVRTKPARMLDAVPGGATRQESVRAGLKAINDIKNGINIVLIHDSVRCFSDTRLITDLVKSARMSRAVIPGIAITDSLKQADGNGLVRGAVSREGLYAVQTPQAFDIALISRAHADAAAAGLGDLSDDAALVEWAGVPVMIIPGSPRNFKLTTGADFARAEAMLMMDLMDIRTGTGFDVHAFAPGDGVWLGGVKVPFDRKLAGHSDADVALHALTDAILGAISDGDIGMHFPPSDPKWKDAASDRFLRHAIDLVHARGGVIGHLDVTIICEAPKVGPHREAIRASISAIAGVAMDRVSVKATTTEKLGFTGRGEGIAAQAAATVRLPLKETEA